jgi:CheY-like chemotaxis protein
MLSGDAPRVIIADDHPLMLEAASDIVRRQFELVAAVRSGAAAVEAASEHQPDVVVLDIAMPGLDGFQAATKIRGVSERSQIVFLSNHAGDDYVVAAMTRGASAFVPKMRMGTDLAAAVEHVCAGRTYLPSTRVLRQWQRPAGRSCHDLHFYDDDARLIESALDYFAEALMVGDSIVAILTAPHRALLESLAGSCGVDLPALAAAGRYLNVDSHEALDGILVNGEPDTTAFNTLMGTVVDAALAAAVGPRRHVTVFGEIAPLLCARGEYELMARVEALGEAFAATRPMSLLCAYPSVAFDAASERADTVCCAHVAVVPPHRG